jgi:hypothetical protein
MVSLHTHVVLLSWLAPGLLAQCPPGAPMPQDVSALRAAPAPDSPADVRWKLGRGAMAANDLAAAREHLLAALEFHASSPDLLFDLLLSTGEDRDHAARWAAAFARAASGADGRVKLSADQRKALAAAREAAAAFEAAQKLQALRAQALADVVRLAERHKAQSRGNTARALVVRWAAECALELGRGGEGMLATAAPALDKLAAAFAPDHAAVWQGLLRILRQRPLASATAAAPTTGAGSAAMDADAVRERAVRAARILSGLGRQAAFEDLQGPPPPDVAALAAEGDAFLADLRAQQGAAKVWTIAELEALDAVASRAFTDDHAAWDRPGIATSTTAKYRIETVCGHGTLLEVARTIERHHARLVDHYGTDPFVARQGIVRIVPEHGDLETEGAPYWWAGGFQAGDTTTVRFAWGTIPDLGRTLTHELTHRFDGVLVPFLGAWFGEGHAEWTGAHYGHSAEPRFTADWLRRETVSHTSYKGYGERAKFERLLRGEVEDYRDNYFAGYSLYAFLCGYPPKEPPRYAAALARYQKLARAGQKDPVAWFVANFCDGKQGRAANLDAFVAEWQTFLGGCAAWLDGKKDEHAWVGRYGALERRETGPMVLDAPTWSWARRRAEPWFGQDHAAAAARLLHEVGDWPAASAAALWSTTVDGWRSETVAVLQAALPALDAADAHHALTSLASARFPHVATAASATLVGATRVLRTFVDALAARARELRPTAPVAAALTAAEHDRFAHWLGLPPLPAEAAANPPPPPPPIHLGGHGWAETSLTDFDDRRVAKLWYPTPEGDLHVGRDQPRDGTGTMDRQAHQRDAFVHSVAWHGPGNYVVRGRVHFTTAYVAGAIVFGHSRRDRDLRLHFAAGDFRYATGREEHNDKDGRVSLRLAGLWERDGKLPGTNPEWSVECKREQAFDFVLRIEGPRVRVQVDGEDLIDYCVHDGAPIEGVVGFATSMGAIRVQLPSVQRLDVAATPRFGLDLARATDASVDDLLGLPTHGVPRHPAGTLVLWLAPREGQATDRLPRVLPLLDKVLRTTHEFPQAWVAAVPRGTSNADRDELTRLLRDARPDAMPVVEHEVARAFEGAYPWLLFVDSLGVLRAAAEVNDPKVHTRVQRWAQLYRSR